MSDRSDFAAAIALMRVLATTPEFTDVMPFSDPHNARARILRNGLIITGFNTLENYLENRADSIMGIIAKSKIPYAEFRSPFKELVTNKSLEGILNEHKFLLAIDKMPYVEDKIELIGQFRKRRPKYTGLGFSPKGSNVTHSDVTDFMTALEIKGGWQTLSDVCTAVGASQPSLVDNFKNFGRSRNEAAHNSNALIPQADLQNHLETALFVGISFDLIVTHAANCYKGATVIAAALASVATKPSAFRFLEEVAAGWIERPASGQITHTNKAAACSSILGRRPRIFTLIKDSRGIPIEVL